MNQLRSSSAGKARASHGPAESSMASLRAPLTASGGRGQAGVRIAEDPHAKVLAILQNGRPPRLRGLAEQTNLDRTHGVVRLPDESLVGYTMGIIIDGRYRAKVGPWTLRGCEGISIRADREDELHRRCQMAIRGLEVRVAAGKLLPWD